jgi:ferric-dicitrate binding protein FerR (iron transport regulator)
MRTNALALLASIACSGIVGTVGIGRAASAAQPAKIDGAAIVRGAGESKVDGARDWRETTTGDVLSAGLTVRAAPDQPLEMILPDAVTITLEAGASARWMRASKLPTETNGWTRGYHLVLLDGELEVRMPPGPKGAHAFLVQTRHGTLTDWRGQLHVMVHADATAAAIYEGALVVGSNGQGFPVYDGAGILMRKGLDPDKTRGIPASPGWSGAGGGFAVVAHNDQADLDFRWTPVPGAVSYRVEVASEPTMVRVVQRAATTEPRFALSEIGAGARSWVRVRAVGAEGIVGEWSAPRASRVLRYDVPAGAVVGRDGALVLADGSSVTLSDADGVEVAYENVTSLAHPVDIPLYWSHLSGAIRLPDDAPMRIIHFRDPVLGGEARLVLARRQLRANVDLLPHNARWPSDPIDARVVVFDPSGRIDGTGEAVTVETMVGLTPIQVGWTHSGSTWAARIPPQPTFGPSVLRVVVRDGHGSEIGRGFLEIDAEGALSSR